VAKTLKKVAKVPKYYAFGIRIVIKSFNRYLARNLNIASFFAYQCELLANYTNHIIGNIQS